MSQHQKKFKIKIYIFLIFIFLLSGCSTVSLPDLEIADSAKKHCNEWEDLPYINSLASELQRVATELDMDSIKKVTHLQYFEKRDDVNATCVLVFKYNEVLVMGCLELIGEKWCAMYVVDAKTAKAYWVNSQYEDALPLWIRSAQ